MDANDNLKRSRPLGPSDIIREMDRKAEAATRSLQAAPQRHSIPEAPPGDDESDAFDPESANYRASGRAAKHPVPALRLIFRDGTQKSFLYAHLDTKDPEGCEFIPSAPGGKGNIIRLRYAGHSVVILVTIEGLRLHRVWEQMNGHLTPWVQELPAEADFSSGNEPVIRSITVKVVK